MKLSGTLLTIAVGMALQAAAAPPTQNPSAPTATQTNAIPSKLMAMQPAAQQEVRVERVPPMEKPSASNTVETNAIASRLMALQPVAQKNVRIERMGNMSSRPWTEIVGWHPGQSQFPDAENRQPQLTLLSVSFGPHPHPR
jgi:hypothetical protein